VWQAEPVHATLRRSLASAAAWTVGAAASVTVGIFALSLVDPGSAAGPAQPLAPDALTQASAGASVAESPSASSPAPTSRSARPSATSPPLTGPTPTSPTVGGGLQRLLSSPGGTVIARCSAAGAYLVSWSPAQGYHVGTFRRGPAATAEVIFVGATKQIRLQVHCAAGVPTLDDDWNNGPDE
jgi:hypothetical protein